MPITVDENYLRQLIAILNKLGGEVVASPGGAIDSVKVLAGYAVPPGESLEGTVTNQGSAVHKILLDLGNLSEARANQLIAFITMTDDAEQLNNMSAQEFAARLPAWVPGGKSQPSGASG